MKEILEEMKYFKEHYKDFKGCSVTLEYNGEQITQIYDYITNLQKSQETLIKNDNEIITNLQEENERLSVELNKNMIERNNCLSRNEKAIEIYKNSNSIEYKKKRFMEDKNTSDLMYETLQGSDKE